jgi:hypothetical protein
VRDRLDAPLPLAEEIEQLHPPGGGERLADAGELLVEVGAGVSRRGLGHFSTVPAITGGPLRRNADRRFGELRIRVVRLWPALASDAIDIGGSEVIDVNGGSGAWTALGLVIVGSLAILVGTGAAVVSWLGALLNT